MLTDELKYRILGALEVEPTAEQATAVDVFCSFLFDRDEQSVMLVRGCAGTGKTTLAAAFVKTLAALNQKLVMLAPTGRAAKVLSLYAGHTAYTIHRRIYRQRTAGDMSAFNLNDNLQSNTLFIIDEASMIANSGSLDTNFGSGRLLDDLIQYVYNGRNCRMMLIGDRAQLPPVGEEESPALQSDFLSGYGLKVFDCDLNEVLRQSRESGILFNATRIRTACSPAGLMIDVLPKIRLKRFADICVVNGDELIETMATSYSRVGIDETMVVTRSNKRANIYNQGIRNMILGREEELSSGDMLMVVRNNYHWEMPSEGDNGQAAQSFIANGDRMRVRRIRNIRELYGLRFADITVEFPDYDDYEITATAILDTLTTESPALTREQMEILYNNVMEDYSDIPLKADRLKKLKQDPYFNALQVKFAYAITCHKAQGGQWEHVYLDQGYVTDDMLSPDYIHWLYTAFTRASEKLFLVNWPKEQTEQ